MPENNNFTHQLSALAALFSNINWPKCPFLPVKTKMDFTKEHQGDATCIDSQVKQSKSHKTIKPIPLYIIYKIQKLFNSKVKTPRCQPI